MSVYSGNKATINVPYVAKTDEVLYVLHRYKKQTSGIDDGSICLNGYIFDGATKQVICDVIESQKYAKFNGRHIITPHTDGSWENVSRHKSQSNYAGKYKKKSNGNGAMLRVDSTGCLFHMGKGANDCAGNNAWTTGCLLLGSNPNGESSFETGWNGVNGPGSNSPDKHASGFMNFYDTVYPNVVAGKTVVLYVINDESVGHPGGTGANGTSSGTYNGTSNSISSNGTSGGTGTEAKPKPNEARPIMASRGNNTVYKLSSASNYSSTQKANTDRKDRFNKLQESFSNSAPELGRDIILTDGSNPVEILKEQQAKTFRKNK